MVLALLGIVIDKSSPDNSSSSSDENKGRTESSEVPKASTDLLVRRLKHSASNTRDSTTDNIHV